MWPVLFLIKFVNVGHYGLDIYQITLLVNIGHRDQLFSIS